MKIYPMNPLAMVAMLHGMNRPLDRDDFGGHVPVWAGEFNPRPRQMAKAFDKYGVSSLYKGARLALSNVGLITGDDAVGQDTWNTNVVTTKQTAPMGALAISNDGRIFRYGSVGATDTVAGSIYQSAAPIANHLAQTPPVVALGATSFSFTPGATAGAANLYADGTLMVDTTPGNGYSYRVAGHPAIVASTAFNLQLYADDGIQVALTASSRVGLHHNPYRQVIVAATTVTAMVCAGAPAIITGNGTAENFGWLQTRGPFAGLINGTPAVGTGLVTSATTAGALDVAAVAAEINVRIIARAMQVGVSGKNNSVFLLLD